MNNIDINSTKIGVIGAGSWGTSLANLLARKGFNVDLWVFEPEIVKQIKELNETKSFFQEFHFLQTSTRQMIYHS